MICLGNEPIEKIGPPQPPQPPYPPHAYLEGGIARKKRSINLMHTQAHFSNWGGQKRVWEKNLMGKN